MLTPIIVKFKIGFSLKLNYPTNKKMEEVGFGGEKKIQIISKILVHFLKFANVGSHKKKQQTMSYTVVHSNYF